MFENLRHTWTFQRVSIPHPLGFNWHPLEGAGRVQDDLENDIIEKYFRMLELCEESSLPPF